MATGFVPVPRLAQVTPRVMGGVAMATVATVAVGVPLTKASTISVQRAKTVRAVTTDVLSWLGAGTDLDLAAVSVDGSRVRVDLVGSKPPPPADLLADALADVLGPRVEVELRWSQRSTGVAGRPEPEETGTKREAEESWRAIVQEWLGGRDGLELLAIDVNGSAVVVDVAGPVPPPSPTRLADLATTQLGRSAEVTVRWTERHSYPALPGQAASARLQTERVRAAAESWASSRTDLDVVAVKLGDAAVTIDLAGEQPPGDIGGLVETVQRELGSEVEVVIRFAERRRLPTPAEIASPNEPIETGPPTSPTAGPTEQTSG